MTATTALSWRCSGSQAPARRYLSRNIFFSEKKTEKKRGEIGYVPLKDLSFAMYQSKESSLAM
jgi:hypothetical protein